MRWDEALAAWLARKLPAAEQVRIDRAGYFGRGASNVTLSLDAHVTCDGREVRLPLVLRPERQDGLLAPYDIGRQYRIMRALKPTNVPVPTTLWLEEDTSILGSRFYLMERVEGRTLPLFWYDHASPELDACAEALALVHDADWRGIGLGSELGEQGSPVETDLAPWRVRAAHAGIGDHPVLVALGDYLVRHEPADARHALLHGDPNPGNYLIRDGRAVAVIDWELAGVGDPRSDLGFYAALLTIFGGWPSSDGETALSASYGRATGQLVAGMAYYEAVGLYKMATVMAGWGRAGNGFTPFYGLAALERRLSALLGPRWAA